jgi:hypothetical protein
MAHSPTQLSSVAPLQASGADGPVPELSPNFGDGLKNQAAAWA